MTQPRCGECGRLITVGSATNDHWLCEYCLVVASFTGLDEFHPATTRNPEVTE